MALPNKYLSSHYSQWPSQGLIQLLHNRSLVQQNYIQTTIEYIQNRSLELLRMFYWTSPEHTGLSSHPPAPAKHFKYSVVSQIALDAYFRQLNTSHNQGARRVTEFEGKLSSSLGAADHQY